MSRKDSGDDGRRSKYGKPSADYYEVAENGLKMPANDNGSSGLSSKSKNLLKVIVPIFLGLAFLAWY